MGSGVRLKCSNCHRNYSACWGVGMLFPTVYKERLEAAKTGEYGPEWQELTSNTPHVAIDAERHVYACPNCGEWKNDFGLSLFIPKNPDAVEECSYVMPNNLKTEYDVLKHRVHICEKCGSEMRQLEKEACDFLPCPFCGGAPEPRDVRSYMLWD